MQKNKLTHGHIYTEPISSGYREVTPTHLVRIVIVEDHPIVRDGLRALLNRASGFEVVGEAEAVDEAKALLREVEPDVLIVDLTLKRGDGIELVRDSRRRYPTLKILVLSMHDELLYAQRLLAAGANGYLMKRSAIDSLMDAIRHILNGRTYLSEAANAQLIESVTNPQTMAADPIHELSDRELQVLDMIGRGLSTKQIGDELHLSVKTVETHRQRIKHKLGLKTSAQLVRYAVTRSSRPKFP